MYKVVECICGTKIRVGIGINQQLPCPTCNSPVFCFTGMRGTTTKHWTDPKIQFLRERWNALHQYPGDQRLVWSINHAQRWYADWKASLPGGSCGCSSEWSEIESQFPPHFQDSDSFFHWSVQAHNEVNVRLGKAKVRLPDAQRRFRFSAQRGLVQPLLTWKDFSDDTLLLCQQILERFPDVSGIAGCPRSGMRAASEIAIRLDVPLYEASAEFGLRRCSSGMRLYKSQLHGVRTAQSGPVVIVEDSTCSGHSVRALRNNAQLVGLPLFSVYAGNQGRVLVDGFAVSIDLPHWFEWNFFGNGQILRDYRVGLDWDGVLNDDCPVECDDDGEAYLDWMRTVRPIRTPRAYRVPFIITARCEEYRSVCEEWLGRYGINYGELVMFPGTFQERCRTNIGEWKAQCCGERNVRLFVESCSKQARIIANRLKSIVLCTYAS